MHPLEFLDSAQQSDEVRRTISTAAILWAVASVIVVLMSRLGWVVSYEDALPFVVLTAWLGAEIVARLPSRIPIAVCEKCERVQILPRTPLRRLWPWKRCTICGGQLKYSCPNDHLLSLFVNEDLSSIKSIWCSRCGQPSRILSAAEFFWYLQHLTEQKPEKLDNWELASYIWHTIKGTDVGNRLREPMRLLEQEYNQINSDEDLRPLKPPTPRRAPQPFDDLFSSRRPEPPA
jgi:hypothetical protein